MLAIAQEVGTSVGSEIKEGDICGEFQVIRWFGRWEKGVCWVVACLSCGREFLRTRRYLLQARSTGVGSCHSCSKEARRGRLYRPNAADGWSDMWRNLGSLYSATQEEAIKEDIITAVSRDLGFFPEEEFQPSMSIPIDMRPMGEPEGDYLELYWGDVSHTVQHIQNLYKNWIGRFSEEDMAQRDRAQLIGFLIRTGLIGNRADCHNVSTEEIREAVRIALKTFVGRKTEAEKEEERYQKTLAEQREQERAQSVQRREDHRRSCCQYEFRKNVTKDIPACLALVEVTEECGECDFIKYCQKVDSDQYYYGCEVGQWQRLKNIKKK